MTASIFSFQPFVQVEICFHAVPLGSGMGTADLGFGADPEVHNPDLVPYVLGLADLKLVDMTDSEVTVGTSVDPTHLNLVQMTSLPVLYPLVYFLPELKMLLM